MSKFMPHLILFDCDGTLVDSQNLIVAAMNDAFEAEGLITPLREVTLSIVGLSLPQAFAQVASEHSEAMQGRLAEHYKHAYREFLAQPNLNEPLYDGVRELIIALHTQGHVLGVATGKSRMGLVRVLREHGLSEYFITLQTADDAASKPHPEMILRASAETGYAPEQAIMIGDTSFDMQMARAAGSHAIGVSWGYHSTEILLETGAHCVVDTASQLQDIIHERQRLQR